MKVYPKILEPKDFEIIELMNGKEVLISVAQPHFKEWEGEPIEDSYGGKAILDFDGEPLFAELAILRAFQKENWNGVWMDTYGRKYRTDWINKSGVELPSDKILLLDKIYENLGSKKGCWDVFCWKDEKVIFAESKRFSKDGIRETQVKFFEAALNSGLTNESFLIVEWSLK